MKKTVLLLIVLLIFVGCIPGDGQHNSEKPAGFFWGIWHGWIAPISLIWSLFNPTIRIYEVNNAGWIYDFGFYLAIVGGFGTLSLSRKRRK